MSVERGDEAADEARGDSGSERAQPQGLRELAEAVLEGIPVPHESEEQLQARLEMVIGQFRSPVPPPFIMREYGEVLPSMPERILAMAERQSEHRQNLENKVVSGDSRRASIGQVMAFVIALAFGYWSYTLISDGARVAGAFLATIDLVALVSVFIYGSKNQADDDDDE